MKLSCDYRFKCFLSSCCTLETYQIEFFYLHILLIILFSSVSIIAVVYIIKKKNYYEEDNFEFEEANELLHKNHKSDSKKHKKGNPHLLNTYCSIVNVFSKMFIIYFLISKVLEIMIIQNYLVDYKLNEELLISDGFVLFKNLLIFSFEFKLIIITFSIIDDSSSENFNNYTKLIIIYLYMTVSSLYICINRVYNSYWIYWINFYISCILMFIQLTTAIFKFREYISRINHEDPSQEISLDKMILNEYTKKLSEEDKELYKETNRFMDTYKLSNILQNIRSNRKIILNIGNYFIFVFGVSVLIMNICFYIRNFKICYLGYDSSNRIDLTQVLNIEQHKDYRINNMKEKVIKNRMKNNNFPKPVVCILLSDLDYDSFIENDDAKEFIDFLINKEKSARLFKVSTGTRINTIPTWFSLFTGTKISINGVRGNILDDKITIFDNIFRKMKSKQVKNIIIGSDDLNEFTKTLIVDATINLVNINPVENETFDYTNHKYIDEKKFEIVKRYIDLYQSEYKTLIKRKNERSDNDNAIIDEYYFNYFVLVHFSELLSIEKYDDQITKNNLEYNMAISSKVKYMKKIYNQLNNDTILLIMSDTQTYSPLLAAKKVSNFSTTEYNLYSKDKDRTLKPSDIASTISVLLGIDIPIHNLGNPIDEIIQLSGFTEDEKKLIYLDLRQQKQAMLIKIAKLIGNDDVSEEIEAISVKYRNPEVSTAEFYFNEINSFIKVVEEIYSHVESQAITNTTIISLIISISVIFLTILLIQFFNYANFIGIFIGKKKKKRRNIDVEAIKHVLISQTLYIIFNYLIQTFYDAKDFANKDFSFQRLTIFTVLPCFYLIFYFKIYSFLCWHKNLIKNENPFNKKRIMFYYKNLFSGINGGVFKENGLALMYLFRVYNLLFAIIFSMIFFFICSRYSYPYSSEKIVTFLLYRNFNMESFSFYNDCLILLVNYLFISLIYFFKYPIYNRFKQIYDSLFVLYDYKIIDALDLDSTCEKDAFLSKFATYFNNFDTQSELFYKYTNDTEINHLNYSEKFYSAMVLSVLLNNRLITLSDEENKIKLENDMMGRDINEVNIVRRRIGYR